MSRIHRSLLVSVCTAAVVAASLSGTPAHLGHAAAAASGKPAPAANRILAPTATRTPKPTATRTPKPTVTRTPKPTVTRTTPPTATRTTAPTATRTTAPTATTVPAPTATKVPAPTATTTPVPTATTTPAPAATTFTVVPSQNVGTTDDNQFNAVAVIAPTDVWAVGLFRATVAPENLQSIIEHFNGVSWSLVPNPNPHDVDRLDGISADSASDVWAVGQSDTNDGVTFPLVEHFNGVSWSAVSVVNPGTQIVLRGVAALSPTNVWIVGFTNTTNTPQATVIEHFDGTAWSIVPSPSPGIRGSLLAAITAVSPTDIWAVGSATVQGNGYVVEQSLTEHWNGTSWSVVATPSTGEGNLVGVSASSSTDVWAVGDADINQLIEHWNGARWSVVTAPAPYNTSLNAVTALGPNDAWAVGNGDFSGSPLPLLEHWDGSAWSVASSPLGAEHGELNGVASLPGGLVWAVGDQIPNYTTYIYDTLTLRHTAG